MKLDLSYLLKPVAEALYALVGDGPLRDALVMLFRPFFLHWTEYADYLLFWGMLPLLYIIPKKHRPVYLLALSASFLYILHGWMFTLFFIAYPALVYLKVGRASPGQNVKNRIIFWVTLSCALFGLGLVWESFPEMHTWVPMGDRVKIPMLHMSGIAFVLPKLIHFIVERIRGRIEDVKPLDYFLYLLFFPCFRIGPIERFPRFTRDLNIIRQKGTSTFDFSYGAFRIGLGLLKTAFWSAFLIEWRLTAPNYLDQYSTFQVFTSFMVGLLEVWMHFSAYCDIAIGTGRLCGIALPENFYFPWFSKNLAELWRRWHVSLSFWLRDYVFLPLGGNRKRADLNYLVTFALCGIWHQISWNWLLWGAIQGGALSFLRRWKIFWYLVEHHPAGVLRLFQPLQRLSSKHPAMAWWAGVAVTIYFFAWTGTYTLHDIPKATWIMMQLFSSGG